MYQIWKNRLIRKRTEYIVLTQAINVREDRYKHFNPLLLKSNYTYTWGEWQKYICQDLKHRELPFHYYVELLDDDYVIYQGLGEEHPSYFINDLVTAGVVKSEYKHAIVIGLGENYNRDIPELRMYEHLCSKCISSLMKRYDLPKERVVYFDDILHDNWKEMLGSSDLTYNIETTELFDTNILQMSINKYKF